MLGETALSVRPADVSAGAAGWLRTLGPRAENALVTFAQENAALLVLSMASGLLAYGNSLVNPALNLDEQLAPAFGTLGHANRWNLGLYRWSTVVFDYAVLAPANLHVLRPVLALALLSVAATLYARLLRTTPVARAFFCLTFMTVPTFAHAMAFSFLSVEFTISVLLFVLGLRMLIVATSAPRMSRVGLAMAVVCWVIAQSFYQDYGIVITAFVVWTIFAVVAGERTNLLQRAATFIVVLVASVALDVLVGRTLIWLAEVPQQAYLVKYYLGSLSLDHRLSSILDGATQLYFSGESPGWMSLGVAAIALPVLGASVSGALVQRVGLALLGVAACLAPIVYGLGTVPPLRATSGLLFVEGAAAALAVARSSEAIALFVKCAVVYLALQNCVAVNDIFHYESLAWDADKALAVQIAARIYDVAPDVHENGAVRVLFVGSYARRLSSELPGRDAWVGAFDTWGENKTLRRQRAMTNAGFPAFRIATENDYRDALVQIESMPSWPDRRSVTRAGDVIIVKLGAPNGFDQM